MIEVSLDNDDMLIHFEFDNITESQFNYFINKVFLKNFYDFNTDQIFWEHFNETIKEIVNNNKTKQFDKKEPRSTFNI